MLFRECNHRWHRAAASLVAGLGAAPLQPRTDRGDCGQNVRPSDRGFTLIEMAIVALVIMIVIAIAVPFVIQYMRMYRVGIGGRNVATALQRARYLATSDNTRAEISIRNKEGLIDILEYNPDGTGEPQKKGLVTLPPEISISPNGPQKIAFDGRGVITPLPRQSPVIEVDGANGWLSTVTVSVTGQVTVSGAARQR
jgi:competence protein ComGC